MKEKENMRENGRVDGCSLFVIGYKITILALVKAPKYKNNLKF